MKYKHLFSEGKIGNLTIQNRTVMTAMETDMAKMNGNPSPLTTNYFYQRAVGKVGLIITGITRVDNITGVSTPRQLSLANNFNIKPMKKFTDKIHETDTKIFCQLHHPGRQTYSTMMMIWPMMSFFGTKIPGFSKLFKPLVDIYTKITDVTYTPAVRSASNIECEHLHQKTKALSTRQVKKIIKKFIKAGVRAKKAGFDGVEIHAAHGYLIQQFLSTRTNKRKDQYGGSFENRYRFLKEILEGIKEKCGKDFPVSVRLSVDEFYTKCEGEAKGIVLEEGVKFAKEIEKSGADAINVTSATYETMNKWLEPVTYTPGWRKYLAEEVKKNVKIPVIAANLIRNPAQADKQIADGSQDFVGLGRPFLSDPYWVAKAENGKEEEITTCINCLHCFESINARAWFALPLECARNPILGNENEYEQIPKDGVGKKAVVIGAGPAGLTSADILAKRGFKVKVYEKQAKAGGQVNLAQMPPLKLRIGTCVSEMEKKARDKGVDFIFNKEADIETILKEKPDKVIYAAGSKPFMPPIKGKDAEHVYSVNDILSGTVHLKKKNIIVAGSGLTGLETAEFLAEAGNNVTVIEMLGKIGPSAYHQNLEDVVEKLNNYNAKFMHSVRLDEIKEKSVTLTNMADKSQITLDADAVVLSIGNRSNTDILDKLKENFTDLQLVGDAEKPGKIADAVRIGYEKALL
ncbi:MAG: FAD-dependent oxidoreductase [Spirochaetales bacterium]|nr:FAD-dependent oxidoreductase [Spirochaetales bacterium]